MLKWCYMVLTHLITTFSFSLRVTTSFKESQYHSKIDTTTQGQLPRAASELKCSLASSSKPILQPPQMGSLKMRYPKTIWIKSKIYSNIYIGNNNRSLKCYFNNVSSCIERDSKDSNGKNNGKEDDEEAKYNARFNPDSQKCGAFEGII